MKRTSYLLILSVCTFLCLFSCTETEKKCVINGKVIDRNSKAIFLMKAYEDPRSGNKIKIPIVDNKFSYEIKYQYAEAYRLIFEEDFPMLAPIIFFPTEGEIKMNLYPRENFDKNRFEGGILNDQYQKYTTDFKERSRRMKQSLYDSISVLMQNNSYYSDPMNILYEKFKSTKNREEMKKINDQMEILRQDGKALSNSAKELNTHLNEIDKELLNEKYSYIEKNQTIVSYYLLLEDLVWPQFDKKILDINTISRLQKKLSQKHRKHSYTQITSDLLASKNIRVGGKYIDFSLPDINGKKFQLSNEIKGKIAIIDIWAPWCDPCIVTSRSMIPVYNEFKEKTNNFRLFDIVINILSFLLFNFSEFQ